MKNVLLIACLSYVFLTGFTQQLHHISFKDTIVYVCGKSKIYHKVKTHSALSRCKSGITEVTETEAINAGKRICKCRG
ncbi:MAG: hypothetical protein ACPGU9_05100 [Flavobacteriaceae bacterium]